MDLGVEGCPVCHSGDWEFFFNRRCTQINADGVDGWLRLIVGFQDICKSYVVVEVGLI